LRDCLIRIFVALYRSGARHNSGSSKPEDPSSSSSAISLRDWFVSALTTWQLCRGCLSSEWVGRGREIGAGFRCSASDDELIGSLTTRPTAYVTQVRYNRPSPSCSSDCNYGSCDLSIETTRVVPVRRSVLDVRRRSLGFCLEPDVCHRQSRPATRMWQPSAGSATMRRQVDVTIRQTPQLSRNGTLRR
jgi:hypothetical protein